MTPKQAFNTRYNGQKNFTTPHVVRYGSTGMYFYELSEGTLLYGDTVYGVTVLYKDDVYADVGDKNMCFYSIEEAELYIKLLSMRKGGDWASKDTDVETLYKLRDAKRLKESDI